MPHIKLDNDFPGIVGLIYHKPKFGRAVTGLTQAALRGPSPLTPAERELIAAYVSNLNSCSYCQQAHSAVASELMGDGGAAVACAIGDRIGDKVGPKMKGLLQLASRVQKGGGSVTPVDIENTREAGASDEEIHDTVFVAAAFCFINRYVDGLGAEAPTNHLFYQEGGKYLGRAGYQKPSAIGRIFIERMFRKFRSNGSAR
jgi:uncharacterized peroxidase-related enzyme